MWKELGWDFFVQHKLKFVVYGLIILFVFPLEAVFLPEIYGKLFEGLRGVKVISECNGYIKKYQGEECSRINGDINNNLDNNNILGGIKILFRVVVGSGLFKVHKKCNL